MLRKAVPATLIALAAAAGAPAIAAAPDERIPLPAGLQPEGIAAGEGDSLYVGSISKGSVSRLDPSTGEVETVVKAKKGFSAIGIEVAGGKIAVAGGETGRLTLYDRKMPRNFGGFKAPGKDTFINDVAKLGRTFYATDSRQPVLRYLTLGKDGGVTAGAPIPLPSVPYKSDLNLNGIEAGRGVLIAVHSGNGNLYRIDPGDPSDGDLDAETTRIDLGGARLRNGDGLLLEGRTLHVVRNQDEKIAVVRLSKDFTRGKVKRNITSPDFDVPTTLTRQDGSLYAVNARFGTDSPETADYWVTRLGR